MLQATEITTELIGYGPLGILCAAAIGAAVYQTLQLNKERTKTDNLTATIREADAAVITVLEQVKLRMDDTKSVLEATRAMKDTQENTFKPAISEIKRMLTELHAKLKT